MDAYTQADLREFSPRHGTFVGVDSDGCVFDTMEVKQKQFFHGRIVRSWGLAAVEKQVRQAAEFVNLYSRTRGSNRFVALLRVFDLLHEWPGLSDSGAGLPRTESLRDYIDSDVPLGNPSLAQCVSETGDAELARLLAWSLEINAAIERDMTPIPPFPNSLRALEAMAEGSDVIVVSQTPEEALVREWRTHRIDHLVTVIAGQELGTKTEHLQLATQGRYRGDQVLMIGDALGDLRAAREAGCLFFPILPGKEDGSWVALADDVYPAFLNGTYEGPAQDAAIAAFEDLLPEHPPWL
ncbi:MAG: HAD family hydrolase [Lentisphaerae bacterium]|jgi:phosphoglycolate phosphatase-like HAD superfamily hydrolase|nr:HAD family hydrolase [Lentisphaerota bacterium]MBT4820919.1 HAD family hydrolase [Lentisphaerota bacterium]MBT5608688.1 HAD family hydrolase [Lentisphaerota bacterium]MBT7057685.1 HAD family hydrolase [Lentisphaerota bacterium]MBT7841652.1 HAD family hydrolase [Lentisphaerota bacterium]